MHRPEDVGIAATRNWQVPGHHPECRGLNPSSEGMQVRPLNPNHEAGANGVCKTTPSNPWNELRSVFTCYVSYVRRDSIVKGNEQERTFPLVKGDDG